MKRSLVGLCLVFLAGPTVATAGMVEFNYVGSTMTADFTLDIEGGQAVSGTGSIFSSSLTPSPESLTLVTLSTTGVNNLGGGNLSYRFGGGTDLIGDTVASATAPYVDSSGLVFMVGGPNNNGFNIGYSGGVAYYSYLVGNTLYQGDGGTLSVAPVPLPAAGWLLISGLGVLGTRLRRRAND